MAVSDTAMSQRVEVLATSEETSWSDHKSSDTRVESRSRFGTMSRVTQTGPRYRLLSVSVLGCLAVSAVDVGGSLISRATGIAYTWFAVCSLLAYCAIGILAAHSGTVASAAIAGLVVAVFDATVGVWISWQIGPGRVDLPAGSRGVILMIMTGILVVAFDTALATVAGAIWRRIRARPETDLPRFSGS
jgi:hypothetical protein